MSQIYEFYTCIRQKKVHKVILTDKGDELIADLEKVLLASHYMFYTWHINKNIIT